MAVNFLWYAGTGNSGLLATAFNLQSTELNTLTTGSIAVSSVGGTSGVFSQVSTGQAIWGEIFLTLGAIGSALSAGANMAGWWVQSYDGGTTFEQSAVVEARSPDFIVPLPATTIGAASIYKAAGLVRLPALQFKVMLQNNTGQSLAATANTVKLAPIAAQY